MTARLLVVQHQDDCPAARFGPWLEAAGCELDVRRLHREDPLAADASDHDGLLVLGGSPGANDDRDAPWLPAVRALIGDAANRGTPTLGICLGHQLAAVALGGAVHRNPRGQTVGLTPVEWTAEAASDPLFAEVVAAAPAPRAIHWNNDIVTALPAGATTLAITPGGAVQAARFAPSVWGVQLHPEADATLAEAWAASEDPDHPVRGPHGRRAIEAIDAAYDELGATWALLATRFARIVAGDAGSALGSAGDAGARPRVEEPTS